MLLIPTSRPANICYKYPDIILLVAHLFKASPSLQSFIIDSEIVAISPGTGELKSFQELSNRPRKDVQINDIKVSVAVYVFDLLYCNSEVSIVHLQSPLI